MRAPPSAGVARLEAFSDAVFGFAATLLVVSLEIPANFAALKRDLSGFVAFGISFGALVLIWTIHAAFFRRYGLRDGPVTAINSVLLFVVLFYVFPLKFVALGMVSSVTGIGPSPQLSGPDELGAVFALYGAGFAAVFLCVALLYRHAWSQRARLGLSEDEMHEARLLMRHYLIFVGVGLGSVGLALLGIGLRFGLPGIVYAALGPLCWWHGERSSRARRPQAT